VLEKVSCRPLKILHLGKYFHPDPGGIESVVKDVVQGTVLAGCEVTVLCLGQVDRLRSERHCGAEILRAPIWKIVASQPLSWRYFYEFLSRARDFDIIQVHVPNMLAALALVMARIPGKVIVHWHADVVNHGVLGKLLLPLERLMLRRADVLVVTSRAYSSTSLHLRQFQEKVHIVPIGISDPAQDEMGCAVGGGQSFSLENIPQNVPIILTVGRLVPYKGFEVLIDAARELPPDCRVVIVGGGERQADLEARIRDNCVADRVILAGRLDEEALRALFRRAAIFCLPSISRAEAFGVVLLEAMARGIPVVATEIAGSGVPWVNQQGVTGLNVPVGDATMLAAALAKLLAEPGKRAEMGRAARHRFEREFTSDRATSRFMELYRNLAGDAAVVA